MKKIVLIGDSIRVGYCRYVQQAFEGEAAVYFPNENCRFAAYIVRALSSWKGKMECGDDVDCVHFNVGLWDCLILPDGILTPIEIYRFYFDRVCKQIKTLFPKAKIIFATSTAVLEDQYKENLRRKNADIEQYNAAAVEIAQGHGFAINDLYAITKDVPESYHSDMTHYYTKDGTRILTEQVANVIADALGIPAKPLDYDALFAEVDKIVGI